MSATIQLDQSLIAQWLHEKLHPSKAEEQLQSKGLEPMVTEAYIKEFKKIRAQRRQKKGFLLTAAGAGVGFISCVLTLTNPVPDLYGVFLYGLIAVSMTLIFTGLYFIFE